jgi:hypothetical protein
MSQALLTWTGFRTNSALTVDAVEEIKATIQDSVNQTQPDLEVQIEEITEGLNSLAIEVTALSNSQHAAQPNGDSSLQVLGRKERRLAEDRLALEAEKKAMEQSQLICKTASERLEGAPSQLDPQSIHVIFSGANNSGFQLGQNTGVISNLEWGAKP